MDEDKAFFVRFKDSNDALVEEVCLGDCSFHRGNFDSHESHTFFHFGDVLANPVEVYCREVRLSNDVRLSPARGRRTQPSPSRKV